MGIDRLRNRTAAISGGFGAFLAAREVIARATEADLHGQVALITGGSRGPGLALARELADQGCRLAICARDVDELERARTELAQRGAEVLAVPSEVADQADVEHMVTGVREAFGTIDLLICNAGVIQVGQFRSTLLADFEPAKDIMCSTRPWR